MRYQQINAFPSVILHDCSIRRVYTRKGDLVVELDDFGFFVLVPERDNYFRTGKTGPARLVFTDCDPDDLDIKEVRTHNLTEDQFFDSMYDLCPQDIGRRVNDGTVQLTFLEEYYAGRSAFFVLYVQDEDESRYCLQVKVSYRTIRYEWDGVDLTSPF